MALTQFGFRICKTMIECNIQWDSTNIDNATLICKFDQKHDYE